MTLACLCAAADRVCGWICLVLGFYLLPRLFWRACCGLMYKALLHNNSNHQEAAVAPSSARVNQLCVCVCVLMTCAWFLVNDWNNCVLTVFSCTYRIGLANQADSNLLRSCIVAQIEDVQATLTCNSHNPARFLHTRDCDDCCQLASTVQRSNPRDPYASNWLERLRHIKRLRHKVTQDAKSSSSSSSSSSSRSSHDVSAQLEDFTFFC